MYCCLAACDAVYVFNDNVSEEAVPFLLSSKAADFCETLSIDKFNGVTFKKIRFFMLTAVRTRNFISSVQIYIYIYIKRNFINIHFIILYVMRHYSRQAMIINFMLFSLGFIIIRS